MKTKNTYAVSEAGQVAQHSTWCTTASAAGSTRRVAAAATTTMGWNNSTPGRFSHALAAFAPVIGSVP